MNNKYFNDAIIGNKEMVASYTKKGELLRLYSPTKDYRQFVDFFHTGVKVNDSNLIHLQDDINNVYNQYYMEDTNILNTEITNTYFNLKITATDFIPIQQNVLCKRYVFENHNTISLDTKFLIHSKLLSDENEKVSGYIIKNGLLQYSHNYVFGIVSDKEISSHQINDTKENMVTGNIEDKDYIGMSSDSSILYDIGKIAPKGKKVLDVYVFIYENKEKETINEVTKYVSQVLKVEIEKEENATKRYWRKYIKDHNGILLKEPENKYEEEILKIYKRSILLFPLLTNYETGGVIASVEIDEHMTKCGRYAYCWPRDAVFITKALDIVRMEKETEKFYKNFCKNTQLQNGMWEQRYYTDGRLAPCWGYQIDETASVIFGVYNHYKVVKDKKFLSTTLKMCENGVKFLKKYIKEVLENKEAQQVSYDLWEMHEGVHLYSLGTVFGAFESMTKIYEELKETFEDNRIKKEKVREEVNELKRYLIEIKTYILENMYQGETKSFTRGINDTKVDISILGSVVPFGMFTPNEKKMINTVENMNLKLRTYTGGYVRFENDHYIKGENPWPIATLWMALYYIEQKEFKKAKECFDFVVKSVSKHGFIGEQVDNEKLEPAWVIGLGWSHAMFILVLEKLARKLQEDKD